MASDGAWLTYREAAALLGSNIEAVRQRAIRSRWPRTVGNDKRARIQIPEGLTTPVREGDEGAPRKGSDRDPRKANDRPLISSLEATITILREQLAASERREGQGRAELEIERGRTIAAEGRANAEAAKCGQAIEALSDLANRLNELAAERSRPWWRRMMAG